MRVLVTGGAGFVGANLALMLRRDHEWPVVALDNLKRRGSELALRRLAKGGVSFVHGDVRIPSDLEVAGPVDLIIECSAEPSVHAGGDGDGRYVVETNLVGTLNCLELARRRQLTGKELGDLAKRMVETKDSAEADRLQEEIVRGFYGNEPHA